MITPLRPLWQALAQTIHSMGINNPEAEFPRVLIDQIELRETPDVKDATTYEITFLVDVVTKSDSPIESFDILDQVHSSLDDQIEVCGHTVQELKPEALTPVQEIEDGIWRQLQRYRIKLIKK